MSLFKHSVATVCVLVGTLHVVTSEDAKAQELQGRDPNCDHGHGRQADFYGKRVLVRQR